MPKTLKLISLGTRGVGKTVFLVSSCANALQPNHSETQDLWFECRDQQSEEMVQKLLNYVNQNKAYPPATFKISDFNLRLKKKTLGTIDALCDIQWIDIPGEWCDLNNQNFQTALLESHGCCVFVDADALLNQEDYIKTLEQNIKQIESITSLINQNNLIQYPIALICTKYDLIHSNAVGLIQLEEKLKPLTQRIESSQSITKRFYSGIPLQHMQSEQLKQTTNANEALLWITSELNTIHNTDHPRNLGQVLSSITQTETQPNAKVSSSQAFEAINTKKALNIALVVCGIIAAASALFLTILPKPEGPGTAPSAAKRIAGFQEVLKTDPSNESAISGIVKVYTEEIGKEDEAINILESLLKQSPGNINLLSSLAGLYGIQGNRPKEEEYFDKILELDPINLSAIQGKVKIKVENGKPNEAREIINRAEKNAKTPAFKDILKQLSEQIPKS